jgi:hypothetical protein
VTATSPAKADPKAGRRPRKPPRKPPDTPPQTGATDEELYEVLKRLDEIETMVARIGAGDLLERMRREVRSQIGRENADKSADARSSKEWHKAAGKLVDDNSTLKPADLVRLIQDVVDPPVEPRTVERFVEKKLKKIGEAQPQK